MDLALTELERLTAELERLQLLLRIETRTEARAEIYRQAQAILSWIAKGC